MAGTEVLVTGGCGRIGKRLVQRLVSGGDNVTVIDPKHGDVAGVKYITTPLDSLTALDGKFDIVYHLAAVIDYRASKDQLKKLNVEPTERLLKLVPDCKQFIFMSTTSVYGESKGPLSEYSETAPYNNYGLSKLECEDIIRSSHIPYTIMRSSQVFGPDFEEGYSEVLGQIQQGLLKIIGDGKNFVPIIHVNDLIDALLLVKGNGRALNNIFNVDGSYDMTQEELVEKAAHMMEAKVPVERVNPAMAKIYGKFTGKHSLVEEYMDKLSRNRRICIDKICQLGFKPKVELDVGLKEVIEVFRQRGLLK